MDALLASESASLPFASSLLLREGWTLVEVSADAVAIWPASAIEEEAHRVGHWTVRALDGSLCQWLCCVRSARAICSDPPRTCVTVAALYCVGTPDVEFTPPAEKLADRK